MSKRSFTKEELQNKIKLIEEENLKLRQNLEGEERLRWMETTARYNEGLAEGRREALELVRSILQTIAWYGITEKKGEEEQ